MASSMSLGADTSTSLMGDYASAQLRLAVPDVPSTTTDQHSVAWRIRDTADTLVINREQPIKGGYRPAARLGQVDLSTSFDVEASLSDLRSEKASIIRSAFEIAAGVVLGNRLRSDSDDDNDNADDDDSAGESANLPVVLGDADSIDKLRSQSLIRAFDNKEWAKRRPAKPSASSAGKPTSKPSKADAKKRALAGSPSPSLSHSKIRLKVKAKTKSKTAPGVTTTGVGTKGKTGDTTNVNKNKKMKTGIKAKKPAVTVGGKKQAKPKFTRNTPASSAAALDSRLTSSRAILCAAANVAFATLTPSLPGLEIEAVDVPQNPNKPAVSGPRKCSTVSNMGAVLVEAQTVGQRVESVATNAARRAARRYLYRKQNLQASRSSAYLFPLRNLFRRKQLASRPWGDGNGNADDEPPLLIDQDETYSPSEDSVTHTWINHCLPRFLSILEKGSGHAFYHDAHWNTRHGRIANLLQDLSRGDDEYFGPHLIVCTEPDLGRFYQEFRGINSHLRLINMINMNDMRAMKYVGTDADRKALRKHFPKATGLPDAAFHVIITSYSNLLKDYLHLCQMPFEVVILDDGASWMSAAQGDPNSPIGQLWENAIWSKSDKQIGLAGTRDKKWDFSVDSINTSLIKESWIGLTARHRILTSSTTHILQRSTAELIPVSGLVSFIYPHYADVVREEWDRSRISNDAASMEHFRRLLTKSCVIHAPESDDQDMYKLAMKALTGKLGNSDRSKDPSVPDIIADEKFVSDGKVAYSRRLALQWLGTQLEKSWLRYELGSVDFQFILNVMKVSSHYGHICDEVITASMTTSTGATGQVAGSQAYRLALRCGRQFGSEQGLRQHLSALHAPPGTWLCRTCGSDCITSQARTHHERSCGQPLAGVADPAALGVGSDGKVGASKSSSGERSGPKQSGQAGVVGKKKGAKPKQASAASAEEKDPDGSIRVPGYRGVWIDPAGKHFVKIQGKRFCDEGSDQVLLFDGAEDAAKRHDRELKKTGIKKGEFNYKSDGSRIVYEDVTTSSTTGLGGSASSVVPALSVINIKDLPSHVKPLLRDPRQTSRTGGNSKRHVYAYRGVCRQARKGHDRWQSQISFMGVNHYLGTFDSEWDAAAIYAWAHLILYGEEATKQAQREGEEAAAAYEKEKKMIEEGKVPEPQAKETKKRKLPKKKEVEKRPTPSTPAEPVEKPTKKKKLSTDDPKPKSESMVGVTQKATGKAPILAPRTAYKEMDDDKLTQEATLRLLAAHENGYCTTEIPLPAGMDPVRGCIPPGSIESTPGCAMLLGLSPALFGWDSTAYMAGQFFESEDEASEVADILSSEYGQGGTNERFRTLMQGSTCVIGRANERTQRLYGALGLGNVAVGGSVGPIDCHIGGSVQSCDETSACIRFVKTKKGEFQLLALSEDDVVTLNGEKITPDMGTFTLSSEDVCTVGGRVFAFVLPDD